MIGQERKQLVDKYRTNILDQNTVKAPLLVISNLTTEVTVYNNSDIFVGFDIKGECVIVSERISRKDYTFLKWLKALYRGFKFYKKYRLSKDFSVTFTFGEGTAQITLMKKEWCEQCHTENTLVKLY